MSRSARLECDVPVLETPRLRLREPRAADLPAMAAFGASARARFVGGPLAPWEVLANLQATIGAWVLRGWSWWTIEDRATSAVAGRCGFGLPGGWDEPELGWHIYDGFEGRGLALEAAQAARRHGARAFGITRPVSLIAPDNLRSRRLAGRLGAAVERAAELPGGPVEVWRHPAEAA